MKISLWVFKIRGFECGLRVPKYGGPLNPENSFSFLTNSAVFDLVGEIRFFTKKV
jgi:hypothetical protein